MLSNIQIDRYYSHEPHYGGCMAQASLKKAQNGKFYILNLDKPSGPGTHWVLLSLLNHSQVYFNSFGFPPDEPIIRAVGRRKTIQYSDVDIQPISSEDCGYYCIAIANELLKGRSFEQALEKFHIKRLNKNDKIATKLSKKRKASIGSGIPIELF